MRHVYNLAEASLQQPSVVTIGVFDGVHRGHQALVQRLVAEAHSSGRQAVALTFHPHPDVVIRGIESRYYLTTVEQRAELLLGLGVDCVITHPFNDETRQIRAADFVDQLVRYLRMESLWVGADFALGYRREGNVPFLREQGQQKNFTVEVVELITNDGHGDVITSTGLRELLAAGEVTRVRDWLGRPYTVEGEVVHGEKRGRKIGFPTANIAVWQQQLIPANGVYAGWAHLGPERFMAVTNVGVRPTFAGSDVTVEAHLLDFDRDIYGQSLRFSFEAALRPEQRFNGIEELIRQIQHDVEAGRRYLMQSEGD